jgi:Tfp pilus assembly protein PilO
MRFIFPTLLIVISVAAFLVFINPTYSEVKIMRAESAQYDEALTNSRKLQEERDALSEKYRMLSPDDLERLNRMLPDNADNIRLILNIQQMAQTYGMAISSIKFDTASAAAAKAGGTTTSAAAASAISAADAAKAQRDYGDFELEFTTTGSYENFQKFLKDMERSLRITDIQSITFGSEVDPTRQGYTYTIKLLAYWLKS